jgi:hypothetical protein
MVVRSLTDIKNNFVRSYPEKRTKGKIGKEGAQSARARRAGVFPFKIFYEQMQVDPTPFFANLLKAIAHQMDWP